MNNLQDNIMIRGPCSLRLERHMATNIKTKEFTTKRIWVHIIPDMQQKDP